MPIGLLVSSELSSITSKCLTLCFNIRSVAIDGDDLKSIVIRGEDIISLFVTSLVRTSLIHTFLTMSRSVTKPICLSYLSRTRNELTFLYFIFFSEFLFVAAFFILYIFFLM